MAQLRGSEGKSFETQDGGQGRGLGVAWSHCTRFGGRVSPVEPAQAMSSQKKYRGPNPKMYRTFDFVGREN